MRQPLYALIPDQKAGDWKRRRAAALARREEKEAGAARRGAIPFLIGQADERKRREGYLSAMEAERAAVLEEIERTKAKLADLKASALPEADQAVKTARARFEALDADADHARRIMEAHNVLAGESAK